MNISSTDITGLVLAGGRGTRMGGVDKGLQLFHNRPLAEHALTRLAAQVGPAMINANRNLDVYRSFGVPVWPDELPDFAGPLAGMLAGLSHCETPYLVTVPCDSPNFPADLVARLAAGLADNQGEIATAYTREIDGLRAQPVFALIKTSLHDSLSAFIASGQRKTGLWAQQHRGARVIFDDGTAFANANTLGELEQLRPAG
jgi:molybdopterin-guanine dinucleotide biosynthesis protein A